mgnify:CR=1 FL=1
MNPVVRTAKFAVIVVIVATATPCITAWCMIFLASIWADGQLGGIVFVMATAMTLAVVYGMIHHRR